MHNFTLLCIVNFLTLHFRWEESQYPELVRTYNLSTQTTAIKGVGSQKELELQHEVEVEIEVEVEGKRKRRGSDSSAKENMVGRDTVGDYCTQCMSHT